MILSGISKCPNQCDFLAWAFCEQCVFYLSKCDNSDFDFHNAEHNELPVIKFLFR